MVAGKSKKRTTGKGASSSTTRASSSTPVSRSSGSPLDGGYRSAGYQGGISVEQRIHYKLPSHGVTFPSSPEIVLAHCRRAVEAISSQRLNFKLGLTTDPVHSLVKASRRAGQHCYMTVIYQHEYNVGSGGGMSDSATSSVLKRIARKQAHLLLSRLLNHFKEAVKDPYCKNRSTDPAATSHEGSGTSFLQHFSLFVVY